MCPLVRWEGTHPLTREVARLDRQSETLVMMTSDHLEAMVEESQGQEVLLQHHHVPHQLGPLG